MSTFRFEADMVPAIVARLPQLGFDPRVPSRVHVFGEVPALESVPDLVAIRFREDVLARRAHEGVVPLATWSEARLVTAIYRRTQSLDALAEVAGESRSFTADVLIPALVDKHWIVSARGGWTRFDAAQVASSRCVTVEAKLRDWRRALRQARIHQWTADATYVALDSSKASAALRSVEEFARLGSGLILVDAERQSVRRILRPSRQAAIPTQPSARLFVAETCLNMLEEGNMSRDAGPVFGWTHPDGASGVR